MPRQIIEKPENITHTAIDSEPNAEVRRVMIERYGAARYLLDGGAKPIHSDDYGTLYRKERSGDTALVMVKVLNATQEPDGSYRDYFLRVPPEIETARAAVAWTFSKSEKDYSPEVQT